MEGKGGKGEGMKLYSQISLPPSWAGWSAILCVVELNLIVADVESRRRLVARISLLQFGVNVKQILA